MPRVIAFIDQVLGRLMADADLDQLPGVRVMLAEVGAQPALSVSNRIHKPLLSSSVKILSIGAPPHHKMLRIRSFLRVEPADGPAIMRLRKDF
jgi:hypothetical protein